MSIELIKAATNGERGEDQKRIAEEGVRWISLLLRKNADYGSSAWKAPVLAPECSPSTAIRVRMSDKIERIVSLLSKKAEVNDESIDDTLRDLGAYCLLELCRPERGQTQHQPKTQNKPEQSWQVYRNDPVTGEDELIRLCSEEIARRALSQAEAEGEDVWVYDPQGKKYLPGCFNG